MATGEGVRIVSIRATPTIDELSGDLDGTIGVSRRR
jgi:hypothetical protein